eukprot:jgi/Botrbrau1/10485/Bobra.0133s0088.1
MSDNAIDSNRIMTSHVHTGGVPAQILAAEEGQFGFSSSQPSRDAPLELDLWDGVLKCKGGPGSTHSDWEVVGPANVSLCGSSPRSLSAEDMEALKPELLDQENPSLAALVEDNAVKPSETLQVEEVMEEVMDSRPSSPYSVEGSLVSSSYTRVSPPESPSYELSPPPLEDPESEWGSDNEGDGSGSSGTHSETDSEEALRDLEALSQEGSLDGLSDSDARLDDPISVSSVRSLRAAFTELVREMSIGEGLDLPMSIAGSFHTVASITSDSAPADVAPDTQGVESGDTVVVSSGTLEDCIVPEVVAVPLAATGSPDSDPTLTEDSNVEGLSSKTCAAKTPDGGLLGLPKRKAVESKGAGYGARAVYSIWEWVKGWAAALHAMLPKVLPGHCAVLSHRVKCLRCCLAECGWPVVATGAAVTVVGLLVFVTHRNRQLARALRNKEDEMTRLIVKVFSLQEKLAVSRRIPILRHTSHPPKCSFGTFASASTVLL